MFYYDYKPYVSAAERKRRAKQALDRFRKKDPACAPVSVAGRAIATTFWGKSWCDNIERYSDFYNRLERGRTYVRRGAVIDLQIAAGSVKARVMGSSLYTVEVKISAVPHARWSTVCKSCSGAIDSLVELLQGRFSKGV
ncbi:MAG: SWIM zinc finger family protein, partial [Burkholderiales bacterium]